MFQSCKILLLSEKVEHLKEEKISLETQLSVANSTTQQLQRDNANVVADLAELRRKLTAVQEVMFTVVLQQKGCFLLTRIQSLNFSQN